MANSGLGRGLGSLIPNKPQNINNSKQVKSDSEVVNEIDINKISTNPYQPRREFNKAKLEELADSIKKHGIIQPLVVVKKGDKYELLAGERRLRASKIAGLKKVPVVFREADDKEKLELALIENIQREDLNPIDLALSYKQLMDEFNLKQDDIAKQLGKSRPVIANTLRYLQLPEDIQNALRDGKISEGHARYLLGLDNEVKQKQLFKKVLHTKMTVNELDKEIKQMGGSKQSRVKINYKDKDKEFYLREFFGAKIEIKRKGKGGQIIINFFSDDELEEIVKKVRK